MPDTPTTERLHDEFERLLNDPTDGHAVAGRSAVLDPGLLQTMHTLRAMDARATPAPDPAFVAHLREDLMHTLPLPAYTSPIPASPARPIPAPQRGNRAMSGWIRSATGAFSTAVTIGLVIALVVATIGWWNHRVGPVPPTPSEVSFNAATATPTQTISLTMSDTAFEPSVLDIAPGTASPITLRITNTGARNHRFAIPILSISLDIPAGETRDVTLPLRDGVFAFFSADARDVSAGLFGQLTIPVGTGDRSAPPLPNLTAASGTTIWSNTTVTLKARPVPHGRPLTTFPTGFVFHPVSIEGSGYGNGEATVGGMNWTLVLAETGEVGWLETGHLTRVAPEGSDRAQATANASPVAAMDSPPVMTAGGPGRSWSLSDTNPRTDGAPRQLTAMPNFTLVSSLVVGDSIIVSGYDPTSPIDPGGDPTTQNRRGEFRRIDLRTGQTIWQVEVLNPWGSLAAQGNLLYAFTTDPQNIVEHPHLRVSAYSLATGKEVWTGPELGGAGPSDGGGMILMDGLLFASDSAGNTVALDPATGQEAWHYPDSPLAASGQLDLTGTMMGVDGAIYVVTSDRHLVRLDARTGAVQATTTTPSTMRNLALQANASGTIVAWTWPNEIGRTEAHAVDPQTLAFGLPSGPVLPFAVTALAPDGTLYAPSLVDGGSEVQAITLPTNGTDAPTTTRLASFDGRYVGSAVLVGGTLLALNSEGRLDFIDTTTGTTTGFAFPSAYQTATRSAPLLWGNVPVVVTGDGTVWLFDGGRQTLVGDIQATELVFDDAGFAGSVFNANPNPLTGITNIILRNTGTKSHTIMIPAFGIDATVPPDTALQLAGIYASGTASVFARTDAGLDPTPGFFAAIRLPGSVSNAPHTQPMTIQTVESVWVVEQGTVVHAMPDADSPAVAEFTRSLRVGMVGIGISPHEYITTVSDADGAEWSLIALGGSAVGWVPSASLTIPPWDATPVATPTP